MLVAALAVSGVLVGPAARPAAPRSAPHALSMAAAGESFSVGVLALQGGFKEHLSAVERQAGVTGVEVRTPADLASVDALILPGGESTAQGHCIVEACMLKPLQEFAASKPVWGVCAGMILLADGLKQSEPQALVGGLHATIERNAFGRQIDSRFRSMSLQGSAAAAGVSEAAYFIRAPAVAECGEGVEAARTAASPSPLPAKPHPHPARLPQVLATLPDGETAVAVRQDNLLATCFHPEISGDDSWLRFFLSTVAGRDLDEAEPHPDLTTVAPWQPLPRPDSAVDTAVKRAFAVFQQGGVIMDVVDGEQARIAEEAGAVAVMALERIPADIKRDGGVARSSDPAMIQDVMSSTSLPVMAKSRIGHFYEARLLEALGVDCIDESEVLTAADETHHIDKRDFAIPFVCGAPRPGERGTPLTERPSLSRLTHRP